MDSLKKEILAALEQMLDFSDRYRARISPFTKNGYKQAVSAHYSLSAELLRGCAVIDGLTLRCSELICDADAENSEEGVRAYSELFNILIDYRKAIELFLSECELAIAEKDGKTASRLIKSSDIFARKTAFLRNTL